MKKLLLTLTIAIFLSGQTAYANIIEDMPTDEKVVKGSALTLLIAGAKEAAWTPYGIGVALVLGTGYGVYQYHAGNWGPDSAAAIKNCIGTHINGNCAHEPLNKAALLGSNVGHN